MSCFRCDHSGKLNSLPSRLEKWMETKPSSDNGARRTNPDVCFSSNGSVMVSLQLRFRRAPSGSCSLGRLDGFIPFATLFLPILLACNRRCMGVNGKLKWLVHGGNYRENDSTLPRLLMAVYTPLLRCATASDACNIACGLRTKQTGSCYQFPVLHFWARFSLRFGTFLSFLRPSLLHHV